MTTTFRVALLAGLLALASTIAVIGFIQWRTNDAALTTLQHQVEEQGAVLNDVYRSGGLAALGQAINDTVDADDPLAAAAVLDDSGRPLLGNLAARSQLQPPMAAGYRAALLRLDGEAVPHEAGVMLYRLPGNRWLLSGRTVGDGLSLRQTLRSSLWIGAALALVLGLVCGIAVADYVERRIRRIVTVADRISGGDLTQRVPLSGADDAFESLARQFNHMLDRIDTLMGELRMLTDTLAHDLRSPLGRLRAAADGAMRSDDRAEREQQMTNVIRQSDALIRILTTVLEIGRSEALTSRNQFTWFDPKALAAELAEMYEPVAEEAGTTLRLDAGDELRPCHGHRQLLAQSLANLIENAIKYAPAGGDIRLLVEEGSGRVQMGVADRGPGIAAEQREEARRRFGRLDASRSAEGAGLGLALVEAVAHLHHGQLLLSDNHPGLVALIDVPLAGGEDPAAGRGGRSPLVIAPA